MLPDLDVTEPTTSYPVSFTAYNPPVSAVDADENAPEIAEWSRIGGSGESIILTAEGINGVSTFLVPSGTNSVVATTQKVSGSQAAVTMPVDAYLLWATNSYGVSEPVRINTAIADWVGFDSVTTGETFYVYGKNLSGSWVYNATEDEWLESVASNPYRAEFRTPATWSTGAHTIYAHNSKGGKYGWSESLSLTVEAAYTWTGTQRDVTSYGAVGDDATDNLAAFNSALSAASAGDTIYVPNGTYRFSDQFTPNKRVRIVGQSTNAIIKVDHQYACIGIGSNAEGLEVSNITLDNQRSREAFGAFSAGHSRNLVFDSVVFTHLNYTGEPGSDSQLVKTQGYGNVLFTNCIFVVHDTLLIQEAYDHRFIDCTFNGVYDCNQILTINDTYGVDISGCTIQNYNASDTTSNDGWAKGRFAVVNTGDELYFGENTFVDFQCRDATEFWSGGTINSFSIDGSEYVNGLYKVCDIVTFNFADIPNEYDGRGNLSDQVNGVFFYVPASNDTLRGYIKDLDATNNTIVVWFKQDEEDTSLLNSTDTTTATLIDLVDENSGEMILTEGYKTVQAGNVLSSTSNTVTISVADASEGGANAGSHVMITAGPGMGQSRAIGAMDTGTGVITISGEWNVEPDATSDYTLVNGSDSFIVYGNNFNGRVTGIGVDHRATTGLQIKGSIGTVFCDNTLTNMRTCLTLYSTCGEGVAVSDQEAPAPNYFAYVDGNTVSGTANGFYSLVQGGNDSGLTYGDTYIIGTVFRGNTLTNVTYTGSFRFLDDYSEETIGMVVMEGNEGSGFTDGVPVQLDSYATNLVLIDNTFSGVTQVVYTVD